MNNKDLYDLFGLIDDEDVAVLQRRCAPGIVCIDGVDGLAAVDGGADGGTVLLQGAGGDGQVCGQAIRSGDDRRALHGTEQGQRSASLSLYVTLSLILFLCLST